MILTVLHIKRLKFLPNRIAGLAQSVASLTRAVGPAMASSLFAFSIEHDILGGKLVWLVLFMLSLLNFGTSFLLRDGVAWRMDGPANKPLADGEDDHVEPQ